jgi:ABC-2 type transport system permease protein
MADAREEHPAAPAQAQAIDRPPALARQLIRVRAFFRKEVNEIRRQPLLILSLIGGPLLVLMIFGASFHNSNPVLRTVIVLPPGGVPGVSREQLTSLAGANFTIVDITENRASAEARLQAGEIDVVQVLPPQVFEAVTRGESPEILFQSNAIDPLVEGWTQYLAYAEVNEINKALLTQQTVGAQERATEVEVRLGDANVQLGELLKQTSQEQQAQIQNDLTDLRQGLQFLERQLPAAGALAENADDIAELRRRLLRLDATLESILQALRDGTVAQQIADIRAAQEDILQLRDVIQVFVSIPAAQIVSPVRQQFVNVRGGAYSAVVYYAPGVLALLVQHTAITLGALALVRERRMGAFEVFRVAPVNMIQLLIGKYLGYTLFIGLSAAVLILMLRLLGIPLLGSIVLFVALLLLLTLASLGIGFLISAVSGSDSQEIQLAMITLLLAIFFSGLFISLDSFARPALAVSYLIPMTHGVAGFQRLMLRGLAPLPLTWIGLGAIAAATFALVVLLTRRQFQRVA